MSTHDLRGLPSSKVPIVATYIVYFLNVVVVVVVLFPVLKDRLDSFFNCCVVCILCKEHSGTGG